MNWQNDPVIEDVPKGSWENDPVVEEKPFLDKAVSALSTTAKNIIPDVKDIAKGLGHGAIGMLTQPIDTEINAIKALPGALINEGKRIGIGEVITGNPIEGVKKFGGAFRDKPVTTALDVLPFLGIGGKGTRAATIAGEAAPMAEAATKASSLVDDLARVAPEAPPIPPPVAEKAIPPTTPEGQMAAVKDYLLKKYGQVAKTPGLGDTIGDLLTRKAKGMRLKEIGFSPGQVRELVKKYGEEKLFEISDIAKERGITKPIVGYKVGKNIEGLRGSSGEAIGGFRELAAKRGGTHNMAELVNSIKSELDPVYLQGAQSGQKGTYMKALQEISRTQPTPSALAEKITYLNKVASKNRLTQSTGAFSDVANTVSRINNDLIAKVLNPAEFKAYQTALVDHSAARVMQKANSFKVGRELAGRPGPGGILQDVYKWGMETFGNKFVENISEGVGKALKKNPEMVKNPTSMMDEILNQMADTLDEIKEEINP